MLTRTLGDKAGQWLIVVLLALLGASCVFPFLYAFGVSLTTLEEAARRGIVLIPHRATAAAYREIFANDMLLQSFRITLFVTIVGTALNVLVTTVTAYPLARKQLPGRNAALLYIVFTMLFSGGLIPQYILVKQLGLLNSVWSLVVPGLVSAFYLMIVKTFFEQLPEALDDAARIDGAGELRILLAVIVPLSLPIMATVSLFYAVDHWNSYFSAVLYINDATRFPMQIVLRNILLGATDVSAEYTPLPEDAVNPIAIQMAAVVTTTVPILLVYPFIQKYFTKGVLLGSVKG
ncbi:MAG: carbohydrate ABC transporter permease [Paenibacillaceae bacterium]|nr:carbohydrate ABC transporter permease [Paenibacillaceae bacterium]